MFKNTKATPGGCGLNEITQNGNSNGFFNFDNSKFPFVLQQQSKTVYRCECGEPVSLDDKVFNKGLCKLCVLARNIKTKPTAQPTKAITGKTIKLLICLGCSGVFGKMKMQSEKLCKNCDSIKFRKINFLNVFGSFISSTQGGVNAE